MTLPLQPLSLHLEELKRFLLRFLLIVGFGFLLLVWWVPAIIQLLQQGGIEKLPLFLLSPLEGFSLVFRLAFWGSFLGTSPFWLIALLQFVQPALHPHEKKPILSLLLGSYVALSLGIWGGLKWILPWSATFFASFNQTIGQNVWSAANYVEFAISILFGMSCLAEICFLFLWLVMHDLISAEVLRQYRRWWILSSFVLGALLTPPDVVSQLCMAIPLILVFEITSLIFHLKSGFFPKKVQNQPKWKKQQLERK